MLARNPTGVAVQLVKWYQCMTVHFQLKDRHHFQIFNVVHLDSYVISDLWSAVLQSQVLLYSGLQYFSTLSLNPHKIPKKKFGNHMCVLIFSTIFLWNIFIIRKKRELIKNIRKSSYQRAVFLVRFTRNSNFPDKCSKNFQLPIFMKFRPCVQTYRQTWRS